jgi:hypothetical protein
MTLSLSIETGDSRTMRAVYSDANNSNIQVDADCLCHETGRIDTGGVGVGVSLARTPQLH